MKTKRFLLASSLLTLLLGFSACSSEGELLSGTPETPVPDDSNGIRIVVHTPAPDDIIMSRAELHDKEEYKVNKLGVYLFLADIEGEDSDYKLAAQKPALLPGGSDGQFTDNGDGTLSYTLPIDASWLGKSAKIALIANDEVTATAGGDSPTTLADFKKSIATNKLTGDDQSADIISGSIYAADASGATGLPMSAMANYSQKEAFTISPLGAELSASLQRIMARVDVCNNTPNLTITGIKVTRAAAQGYLFPQTTTAAPAESYFTMTPTGAYTEKLATDGIGYTTPQEGSDAKTANTHKHMFYLYEQVNAEGSSVEVVINYKLLIGKVEKEGSVSVPLKTNDGYIPTTRNNLYTIVVGNGKAIKDHIEVTELIVNNWEATTDVEGELKPGEDEDIVPGFPKNLDQLEIGDYYMCDGTIRDKENIPVEAYPYVIGVVFQTYKNAPNRFETNMQTKEGETLTTPHGLVMAVKKIKKNILTWGPTENDDVSLIKGNIAECYQDYSGLANWNFIKGINKDLSDYPAFQAVAEFEENVNSPTNSTGWFLPTVGQWWDIVENFSDFGNEMKKKRNYLTSFIGFMYSDGEDDGGFVYLGSNIKTAQASINEYMNRLDADNYDKFEDDGCYFTSTKYNTTLAYFVCFNSHRFYIDGYKIASNSSVRPILAF